MRHLGDVLQDDVVRGRPPEDRARYNALVRVAQRGRALAKVEQRAQERFAELAAAVAAAKEAGATWEEIGRELGVSRQGAQKRFGGR